MFPPPDEIFWTAGYPPEGVSKYINFQFYSMLFLLFITEVVYDSLIKADSKAKIRPSQTLSQKFLVSKNNREMKSILKERYDDILQFDTKKFVVQPFCNISENFKKITIFAKNHLFPPAKLASLKNCCMTCTQQKINMESNFMGMIRNFSYYQYCIPVGA